ncbi:MAG: hypothetical protein J0L93_08355 [Deltaproteobacteria bacterium]|nr:hypothetical protein [Deltaproteobacteria bacterium]
MRRTRSYDEELSKELRDPEYAYEFILGLMEGEGALTLEDALRRTIEVMGVKEFCALAKSKRVSFHESNVVDFLKGKRNPKADTLNSYLKPWKLKAKLTLSSAA